MRSEASGEKRKRLTQTRVDELHERIGALTERLETVEARLEQRDGAGVLLAEAIGQASLAVLRRVPSTPRKPRGNL